jgi:hypothetical protein
MMVEQEDVPTIDEIIKDPTQAKLPAKEQVMYTLMYGLARCTDTSAHAMQACMTYVERMPAQYAVTLMVLWRESTKHRTALIALPSFMKWLYKPGNDTIKAMFSEI